MGRDFGCNVNLDQMQKWYNGVFRRENIGFICKVLRMLYIRDSLHLQGGWRELPGQHPAPRHGEKPSGHVRSLFSAVIAMRSFCILDSRWAGKHN